MRMARTQTKGKTATPRMRARREMGRSMRVAVGQRQRAAGRTQKGGAAAGVKVTMSGTTETGPNRRQGPEVGRRVQERGRRVQERGQKR